MYETVRRRKVVPARLSVSGLYCFRGERMIAYESALERDLLRKLAFSRRVMAVETQPLTLGWRDPAGRVRHYTPDVLVHWRWMGEYWRNRDLPWLIEVTTLRELRKHWSRWHPKFRLAARYAAERGWRFRILDESRIRDVVFQNAILLERYSRWTNTFANDAVLADIRRAGIRTAGELVSRHFPSADRRAAALPSIWRLVATGFVDCDLTQPLGTSTDLWIPTHDD